MRPSKYDLFLRIFSSTFIGTVMLFTLFHFNSSIHVNISKKKKNEPTQRQYNVKKILCLKCMKWNRLFRVLQTGQNGFTDVSFTSKQPFYLFDHNGHFLAPYNNVDIVIRVSEFTQRVFAITTNSSGGLSTKERQEKTEKGFLRFALSAPRIFIVY